MRAAGVVFGAGTRKAGRRIRANKGGAGIGMETGLQFSTAETIERVDGFDGVFGQEDARILNRNPSADGPGQIACDVSLSGFGRNGHSRDGRGHGGIDHRRENHRG